MKFIYYYTRKFKILLTRYFERPITIIEQKRVQRIMNGSDAVVIVYSIGKVGSSSVYESLKENPKLNYPVFHIHSLNPERIAAQERYYRQSKRNSIPFTLIQGKVLANSLSSYTGKIYLFTLIREPIIREISSLFQDSFNFFNSKHIDESKMENIIKKKLKKLRGRLPEEEWFENELNAVFGINIYSSDFDPKKGFILFSKDNLKLALTRLENLDEIFDEVCKHLFETDYHFVLKKKNRSDKKFYHEQYSHLKKELELNKKEIDEIVDKRFIQIFYPDYVDVIRERWQENYENCTD